MSRLGLRPLRQSRRYVAQWRYGQNRYPHRTAQRHRHPSRSHLQHPGQSVCDESGGRQGSLTIIQVEPQNNGKEYVVISGLQEGDVIIAKGAGFVEEGTVIVKP